MSSSEFADDTFMFISDNLEDRLAIKRVLTCFQKASGNEVKIAKSWKGSLEGIHGQSIWHTPFNRVYEIPRSTNSI